MSILTSPPEIISNLIRMGAGSAPMLEAAQAWNGLAAELGQAAQSFSSLTSNLAGQAWQGAAAKAMLQAAAPYTGWLSAAASQATGAASQAQAVASAFEAALTSTVHPVAVNANRNQLVNLVMSNIFGQNAPAIAATEAYYEQMWAQDVAAMVGYHGGASAAAGQLLSGGLPSLPSLGGGAGAGGGAAASVAGPISGSGAGGGPSDSGTAAGGGNTGNPGAGVGSGGGDTLGAFPSGGAGVDNGALANAGGGVDSGTFANSVGAGSIGTGAAGMGAASLLGPMMMASSAMRATGASGSTTPQAVAPAGRHAATETEAASAEAIATAEAATGRHAAPETPETEVAPAAATPLASTATAAAPSAAVTDVKTPARAASKESAPGERVQLELDTPA